MSTDATLLSSTCAPARPPALTTPQRWLQVPTFYIGPADDSDLRYFVREERHYRLRVALPSEVETCPPPPAGFRYYVAVAHAGLDVCVKYIILKQDDADTDFTDKQAEQIYARAANEFRIDNAVTPTPAG
jgi:hypothetical protein